MTGKVVLIVASHPDDEVLGVGGTACAHATADDTVEVIIVAEGATALVTKDALGTARFVDRAATLEGALGLGFAQELRWSGM